MPLPQELRQAVTRDAGELLEALYEHTSRRMYALHLELVLVLAGSIP